MSRLCTSPFFQGLIEKEGFVLAKGDEAVLRPGL